MPTMLLSPLSPTMMLLMMTTTTMMSQARLNGAR